MKNYLLRFVFGIVSFIFVLFSWNSAKAQLDSCDANVPYNYVDLTGQPQGSWISPVHSRQGNCCGTTSPDNCTSFEVVLDSNAAALSFDFYSGAVPPGSMFFQIDCGPQLPVGELICIAGVGPHRITFCKPGNNQNEYIITSIAKPTFPQDDSTRAGCSKDFQVLGFDLSTITWQSVFPGAPGDYDNLLSCTDSCDVTTFTPTPSSPAFIDYVVCGFPQADECGYILTLCDTFRVYTMDSLLGSVTPNPGTFCQLGPGSGVTLNASAIGGNGVFDYTWYDTSGAVVGTGPSYFATAQQTYTLEVNDGLSASSCAANFLSVPVVETSEPIVNAGADQLLCPDVNEISLSGTLAYASGAYWSGGNGTYSPDSTYLSCNYSPTPAEIASGLLELYLTSTGAGGSCPNRTDTVQISFPVPIDIQLQDTALLCSNDTVDLIPVVTGGIAPYDYLWNNGMSTTSINVGEGVYCLSITDALGCIADTCVNVTVPSALQVTMGSTAASTNGGTDGDATATPSGGTIPYQYLWNPGGGTTSTISSLGYGIYEVTVTDSNGCTVQGSVVVNEPRCLGFSVSTTVDSLLCFGNKTATATANPVGGTLPYSYLWDDPTNSTNQSVTNLSGGLYTVAVTDSNNCYAIATAFVYEPDNIVNTITSSNVTTVGGNDGSATANPFGGTPPYTYLWSTSATTQTVNGLMAGTYYLTITDDNGCSVSDSVYINEPPCNNFMLYVSGENVSCNGGSDGSASVFVVGGTTPYDILWSNAQTTSSITNLFPGNYTAEVTDSNGCYSFSTITITEPNPLLATATLVNDISCNGAGDGTVDLVVVGGIYPYTYNWSNGSTSEDLVYLNAGTYTVNVTDDNGCMGSDSVTITEPQVMSTSYTYTNVTCYGDSNATIDLSVNGGILPYSYLWSTGDTTQDMSNIPAGLYWVDVQDANNCALSTAINILITEPPVVDLDSFFIHCPTPGDTVTTVDFYPTGGSFPYQISVDSGSTYLPFSTYTTTLGIGDTYYIMIKDFAACTSAYVDTIMVNPGVVIDSILFDQCYTAAQTLSGVEVFPSGGTGGAYQVSFDNGSTYGVSGDYTDSLAINNTYYVVAMDSSSCLSLTDTIVIPDRLVALAAITSNYNGQDVACYGDTNGTALATQTGGEGAYSYLWSNGQTAATAINLGAGAYTVVITDNNGCVDSASITLSQPDTLSQTLIISSNYNGADVSCNGSTDGAVDLTSTGGTAPHSFLWSNAAITEDLSNIGAGTYTVQITDANGCIDSNSITLTEPDTLSQIMTVVSDYNGANVSCNGLTDGSANVSSFGGVGPYTFLWDNGQTDSTVINIGAGTYMVQITDANGCIDSNSITLTEPDTLSQIMTVVSDYNGADISCNGLTDGSANVSSFGGVGPYTFLWDNGQTDSTVVNIGAGTYTVQITDANGCVDSNNITLTEPDTLSQIMTIVSDYNGANVSCNGLTDGSANVSSFGGVGPYTFLWDNGQTDSTVINIGAGTYMVQITDANGCIDSNSITLTEPDTLSQVMTVVSNYNGYDVSCNGSTDGSANVSSFGGTAPYTFLWDNGQTDSTAINLGAGTYVVQIMDVNGCVDSNSIVLNEPDSVLLSAIIDHVKCNAYVDGSIDLTVIGGVTPYTYGWSNMATTQDISNIGAGTYWVTVTDLNSCVTVDTFEVNEEFPLVLTTTQQNVSCYGLADGSLDLTVGGGVLPYAYLWDNGATSEDLTGLVAGTYNVLVTDSNNCFKNETVIITEPDSLWATINSDLYPNGHHITLFQMTDGSIDLEVFGGTIPYVYDWSNGANTQDLNNIGAGTYTVIITDSNGCSYSTSIELTEPFDLQMPTVITTNGDGKNDYFLIHGLESYPTNQLIIFNRWGDQVYEMSNYDNQWEGKSSAGDDLPAGNYYVILNINNDQIILTGFVEIIR